MPNGLLLSQSSGSSLFAQFPQQPQQGTAPGRIAPPSDPAFSTSGGRALGSSGPVRRTADRTAVLAAAEKRATQQAGGDDQV